MPLPDLDQIQAQVMRSLAICMLLSLALAGGCGPSEDQPTPEQAAQLNTLRQTTIKQLERSFGRALTDEEKQCVVVKLKDGKLDSYIAPPLSETLEKWSRQTQTKRS